MKARVGSGLARTGGTDLPAAAASKPVGAGRPSVSVVVVSCGSEGLLGDCLASVLPQCREQGAELIVARSCDGKDLCRLETEHPAVRFVHQPRGSSVPRLRAAGMAEAMGDIVLLTEDHCVVAPEWIGQLVRAHGGGADVVGGAMDNAQKSRTVDWAAFFAEYGFFAQEGGGREERPLLTGANVSYARKVVAEVIEWAAQGEWENVAHARLMAMGSTLQFLKTAAVCQNRNYRFRDFCLDRYEHGRDYARRRLVDEPGPRRWLYLGGTGALPFLLCYRVARAMAPGHRRPFLRALPITVAFLAAWSLGEAVGYLLGPWPAGSGGGGG